ncbi:MAG: dienelactone hydrolase family protein [Alphaproteobacteria bacterium]
MGNMIELEADDGHRFSAYQTEPRGPIKGSLVIVQEIFGLTSHIRRLCDNFADEGYITVAPALFDRAALNIVLNYDEVGTARGRELRTKLGNDLPLRDIAAAIALLCERSSVAIIGECWGGSLAWLAATRLPGCLEAAICYYGGQISEFRNEKPQCPILMHFGNADSSIPPEAVAAIRKAHPYVATHLYPAGHGFNCQDRATWHEPSAQLAHRRTLAFIEAVMD